MHPTTIAPKSVERTLLVALLALLALAAPLGPAALAGDGTVTVRALEAHIAKEGNDDVFGPQQDFYVCSDFEQQGMLVTNPEIGNHDHASWPNPLPRIKVVPGKNQRFFEIYFELWDDDDTTAHEGFDINPQNGPVVPGLPNINPCTYQNSINGVFPHIRYDVCTGELEVSGVNGSLPIRIGNGKAQLNGINTLPGGFDNSARLLFEVTREPSNWLPDDVAITSVEIVQSVKGAVEAVADKPTSLLVTISNTHPFDISAPVTGTLTDGITTVADSKTVFIERGTPEQPSETLVALFDGANAPPFRPQKLAAFGNGRVSGSAQVVYQESLSPHAPPQLMDCANINNIGEATELPLKKTTDRYTLFIRYDYEEDKNVITFPQLQTMQAREDALRLASWPLAALDSHISPTMLFHDHGSWFPFFEPFTSVLGLSIGAQLGGIDRMVLSVRKDWFAENLFRHQFIASGTIGYSLGWFAPHAVLAEDGYFGVAVHELGHTYDLSQHACNTGGYDEYAMTAQCGAPFTGQGFDPAGTLFPTGYFSSRAGLRCPGREPIPGEVCAPNIMDANSPVRYDNWIDPFTYHYLMDKALPHVDPPLLALAAVVHLPNGPGDGSAPPVIEGSLPLSAYQFTGNQDLEMAPLSFDGETFLGVGPYRVRFVTPTGVREYRVEPHMIDSASSPEQIGAIALNFPWDPATVRIELLGPVDLRNDGCWNRYCPGDSVLLASRLVSPAAPAASDLRAGRDAAAPPTPPGSTPATPTVGPNHEAVVSWTASDADSPDLRATLLLAPQDAAGGTGGPSTPVGIELTGSSFRIPHALLADAPGLYTGRVLVSDGVNTAELYRGQLFSICNLQNGGLELCNGLDDDCDGLTDNTPPGPVESVMLNPQPYPPTPAGFERLSWARGLAAQTFDVVFGDAVALRNSVSDFSRATLGCLANDVTADSYGPLPTPGAGGAFWFDVRASNCAGPGSYDPGDPGQRGTRDAGIAASDRGCP